MDATRRTKSNNIRSVFPKLLLVTIIGLMLILTGCDENETTGASTVTGAETGGESAMHTGEISEPDKRIVTAHNRFGLRLFQQLVAAGGAEGETVFISPTGIALALSMLYNGAEDATRAGIAEALQFGDLPADTVNEASFALMRSLLDATTTDDEAAVRLNIANSIWHRREFAVGADFRDKNRDFFQAEIEGLDFGAPESVATINDWVKDKTEGLIPAVVDGLDADLAMMLINAVYFKGDWTTPFRPEATRDLPFHFATGAVRDVPQMYRSGRMPYYAGDDFELVRLPYGEDERLAMYVFVPREGVDPAAFIGNFNEETYARAVAGLVTTQGELTLPRLDVEYKTNLNDVLRALGMGDAFNPARADFSGIGTVDGGNLYVSDVIHNSVLKVDEEGTEAAAVTSIDIRVTSLPVSQFHVKADRPFVLTIADDETGAVLFAGAVMNPLQ